MRLEARNPFGEFLPPPVVMCPQIVFEGPGRQPTLELRSQMTRFQRSQEPIRNALLSSLGVTPKSVGFPYWHQLMSGKSVTQGILTPAQETSIADQNKAIDKYFSANSRSADWWPGPLVSFYQQWINVIHSNLIESGIGLPSKTERLTWNTNRKHNAVRNIIRRLFPKLKEIGGARSERKLFREKKVEQYVDEVALPNAIGYWDWMLAQLPPEMRQPLELSNSVRSSTSILDLIDIYAKSHTNTEADASTGIDRDEWEAGFMLSLVYVATIADLARNPLEDDVLVAFNQAIAGKNETGSDNFPEEANSWHLLMSRDPNTGNCIQVNFADPQEYASLLAADAHYGIDQTVIVHRYNHDQKTNVFIFPKSRNKELFSRMFKMWRGRPFPLVDLLGARFVVYKPENIPGLIKVLQEKLSDWDINKEPDKSTTSASAISDSTKLICSLKTFPECKIELQIETIMHKAKRGTWMTLEHEPDTNPKAFRVKQLLEMLPIVLPVELYGIEWVDEKGEINPELFRVLMKHANLSLFE